MSIATSRSGSTPPCARHSRRRPSEAIAHSRFGRKLAGSSCLSTSSHASPLLLSPLLPSHTAHADDLNWADAEARPYPPTLAMASRACALALLAAVMCGAASATRNGTAQTTAAAVRRRAAIGGNGTKPTRIFYVHIPKCGTSFQHALLQYACDFPSSSALLLAWKKHQQGHPRDVRACIGFALRLVGALRYPRLTTPQVDTHCPRMRRFMSGHMGMPLSAASNELFVVVRDPIDRVVSGRRQGSTTARDCRRDFTARASDYVPPSDSFARRGISGV